MSDDMTLDDLTVVGIDGIRRSFDEHYDTMMCVEQDPTGAHHAILNQHARIKELEAKLEVAVEALLAFQSFERSAFFGQDADKNKQAVYRGVKRKITKALAAVGVKP